MDERVRTLAIRPPFIECGAASSVAPSGASVALANPGASASAERERSVRWTMSDGRTNKRGAR